MKHLALASRVGRWAAPGAERCVASACRPNVSTAWRQSSGFDPRFSACSRDDQRPCSTLRRRRYLHIYAAPALGAVPRAMRVAIPRLHMHVRKSLPHRRLLRAIHPPNAHDRFMTSKCRCHNALNEWVAHVDFTGLVLGHHMAHGTVVTLSTDQYRALIMIARTAGRGCPEASLTARGFSLQLMSALIHDGFASASPKRVRGSGRSLWITAFGLRALAATRQERLTSYPPSSSRRRLR
jgi:hypothetical protein